MATLLRKIVVVSGLLLFFTGGVVSAQTIVDEWATIKAPPPPELKPVTVDPKVTALLVLDILKQTCNRERRPRCVASIPKIQSLLTRARANGIPVIHSHFPGTTPLDFWNEVAPSGGEPVVSTVADKFIRTDLEKILKEKGMKPVVVGGPAAEGAALMTASVAALRGFQVIVPVDGASSSTTYAEQYTAWHLTNAPTISQAVTLTRIDMIKF